MQNSVFLRAGAVCDTAPEQKTENAKNSKGSIPLEFLNRCLIKVLCTRVAEGVDPYKL